MRLGLIARMDNSGLGNQTWEYYRHLSPAKTLVIDLSKLNEANGKKTKNYPERYEGSNVRFTEGFPSRADFVWLCQDIDVLFSAEIFYGWWVVDHARQQGVKTVLHYNYEFLDYLNQPHLPNVDLLLAPSQWHSGDVIKLAKERGIDWSYLPLGVDRERLPYRKVTEAKTFVHIAGQPTLGDRNGTLNFIYALNEVKSKCRVIIYSQAELPDIECHPGIEVEVRQLDADNYWELYQEGDVLVMPRKYGGQCMPLNEAQSVGMAVLMPNTPPQSEFLHRSSLIPCWSASKIQTRAEITVTETDPVAIAKKMDELVMFPQLTKILSEFSNSIATSQDWARLAPEYKETFEKLCKKP